MPSLMIRFYSREESSAEDELKATITVPLNIFNIVAKHIPDQILRLIYDRENPNSGSAAINLRTIAQTINEILQEIEAERRVGELNGVIAEFVLEPENVEASQREIAEFLLDPKDVESSLEATPKEMEGLKVVFSIEGE
jgi:hypothetical protein